MRNRNRIRGAAWPLLLFLSVMLFHGGFAAARDDLAPPPPPPAQPLTIDGAVDYGMEHNPVFQASREDLKAAQEGVNSARAGFLPRLDTSYSYTRWQNEPFSRIEGVPGFSGLEFQTSSRDVNHWQAEVTQPLFKGFGVKARYDMSKEERNVAGFKKDEARLNLVRNIRNAFIRILLYQRVEQVAKDAVSQLEAHLADAKALFRQGLAPQNDVLKAEVVLADARQTETSAAKTLLLARAQLNRFLGIEEKTELDLVEWTKTPSAEGKDDEAPALGELWAHALEARPELSAIASSIRETEQGARMARSAAYPHLSLFGTYYREGWDFSASQNDFANNYNAAFGVRMDWNLFEGGRMNAEANQWRYKEEASKKREQDLVKQVRIEVEDSYEQLRVARVNLATARAAVEQAEENLRMTTLQYRQQVVISTEVLDAQVYLTRARTNFYQALYGYQLAWVDLERAVGESL